MDVNKSQLAAAVAANIISSQQAEELYQYLSEQSKDAPKFTFTHVLYYLGGMIAIGAMTVFMSLGWEAFGGAGILVITCVYAALGFKLNNVFAAKQLMIPAGICATFVVCLTPLAIYGLQVYLGLWPDDSVYRDYHRYIQWHWLYMELGTLAVAAAMAWKYKYPFLFMPIALTLWYMSMDMSAMLSGGDITWELRKLVSLYSGLLMIGLALWIDIRSRKKADYAFWIYLFGVLAFWGGLSLMHSNSELSKFFYLCINLVMIGVGVLLVRRIFVVCGALGACGYLGYLASSVFKDSWLFPVALSAIGLGIVYFGVVWQKHEQSITRKSRTLLPDALRDLLETKV